MLIAKNYRFKTLQGFTVHIWRIHLLYKMLKFNLSIRMKKKGD